MFAVPAVVLTGAVLVAYATDVFRDAELDTVDARFAIHGDRDAPDEVVVVAIDDVTFNELQQRWPFPRSFHARAVDRLREAGAKVIAYDVQFTEPSEDEDEDNALIEAVGRAKNVLLGTEEVKDDGSTNVLGGEEVLEEYHAEAASGAFPNDPGGVLRRMYHDDRGLTTLGVRAAERYTGREVGLEPFNAEDDTAWVDYAGPPRTVRDGLVLDPSERQGARLAAARTRSSWSAPWPRRCRTCTPPRPRGTT